MLQLARKVNLSCSAKFQNQPPERSSIKKLSLKTSQYSQETPVLESLVNKVVSYSAKIYKNTFFIGHFWWLLLISSNNYPSLISFRLIFSIWCTTQKMKSSSTDFFSKYYQIHSFLRIWSHLLKKSVLENFIFCVVMNFHYRSIC